MQVGLRLYLGDTRGLTRRPVVLADAEGAPPLVVDANGDLRPDLLAQLRNASDAGDTLDADASPPPAPLIRAFWMNTLPREPSACFNALQ